MCSFLNYISLMKYGNFITKFARRQTVGNINGCFIRYNIIELTVNFCLYNRI